MKDVSIPYGRESLSKVSFLTPGGAKENKVSIPYGRESLSKALLRNLTPHDLNVVSIPYGRESLSKDDGMSQFTGIVVEVSIPYGRESLSKAERRYYAFNQRRTGFNSLRTGKPIQRQKLILGEKEMDMKFQFPTDGKAYPKKIKEN